MPRQKSHRNDEVTQCVPAKKCVLELLCRIAEVKNLSVADTVEALATDWVTECVPVREHKKWLGSC
jgi:hypothetical protein